MHIFHNTNFDFLRWRWHAVILSWVLIIAGLIVGFTKGVPLGLEFAGGTAVIAQFDKTPTIDSVRRALDRSFPSGGENVVVQTYGDPSQRQVMIRVPQVGTEGGAGLSATRAAVESALRAGSLGNFAVVGTEIVSPTVGRDLSQKGLSAFVLSLLGILGYIAFRFEFSFAVGRRHRDDPRHPRDVRVPGVFPVRPDAERDRRDVDGHRLLDQRHDRHLRPRAREPAGHAPQDAERDRQHLAQSDARSDGDHRRHRAACRPSRLFLFGGEVLRGVCVHDDRRHHHGHLLERVCRRGDRDILESQASASDGTAAPPSGDTAAGQGGKKQKRARAS